MSYKALFCIVVPFFLNACYFEGSNCSGPLCLTVGADFEDDDCRYDCESRYRCPDTDRTRILARDALNAARQSPAYTSCTTELVSGSPVALVWNETLFAAADRQARDMASNNFVDGLGSDGVTIENRVAALDSSFTSVSQLVAGGFADPRALIEEWLRRPDECSQLTNNEVSRFAMACRYDSQSDYGTYWSLVLANK